MEGPFQSKRSLQMPTLKRELEGKGSLARVGLVKEVRLACLLGVFSGRLQDVLGNNFTFSAEGWTDYSYFCFSFCGSEFQVIIIRKLSALLFFLQC